MVERNPAMARPNLAPHSATLTRMDPDPRVRHRADALVLVADGLTLTAAQLVWCISYPAASAPGVTGCSSSRCREELAARQRAPHLPASPADIADIGGGAVPRPFGWRGLVIASRYWTRQTGC